MKMLGQLDSSWPQNAIWDFAIGKSLQFDRPLRGTVDDCCQRFAFLWNSSSFNTIFNYMRGDRCWRGGRQCQTLKRNGTSHAPSTLHYQSLPSDQSLVSGNYLKDMSMAINPCPEVSPP